MAVQSFAQVIGTRARVRPDDVIVVSDHEEAQLTAAELDARSGELARTYLACGVTHNSLVTVALANSIEFVVACVAIWKAGATPNPVDPELPDSVRAELETLAQPALVIDKQAIGGQNVGTSENFKKVAGSLPNEPADSWKATTTSGSTGRPKIVLAAAPARIDPLCQVAPFLPPGAVQLVTAPLWHSAQFTYAFRGLLTGHRLVLADRFDEKSFPVVVNRYRATWTMLSPSDIHRLVRAPERPALPSLRHLLHLGAPCAPTDKRALINWLGPDRVVEVYAGSESNGLTMIDGRDWLRKPGSVGKPVGGTEIRIVHDDDSPAEAGEIGQVWLRRGECPSYAYRGGASRRTADGWDTLGDLGYLDADGFLFLVERAADVIDRDGVTVYPSRVEHTLHSHPCVRDAVVFADDQGQVAAVVDIADTDVDSETLRAHIRPHLTPAEMPHRLTFTRSPLRNSAGKVRRSAFRSQSSFTG